MALFARQFVCESAVVGGEMHFGVVFVFSALTLLLFLLLPGSQQLLLYNLDTSAKKVSQNLPKTYFLGRV